MIYIIQIIIYLSLFLGVGYLLLKFFSKLSGVNMFKAIKWGFKAKRLELVLNLILFYFIAYIMFFVIITGPAFMLTAYVTQKGGLLGYQDENYIYKYYDPFENKYIPIKHYNPPPLLQKNLIKLLQ